MVLSFYPNPLPSPAVVTAPELVIMSPSASWDTDGSLEWLLHARCLTVPSPASPSDLVLGLSLGGRKRNVKVKVSIDMS